MNIAKDKTKDFSMTIAPSDGDKLTKEQKNFIQPHVIALADRRSTERKVRNEMLSVLYRLEEYLQQEDLDTEEVFTIEYFVSEFCKVLGLNKSQFAGFLEIDTSNLNKYLRGQRAFNTELAMKFSRFFHTPVDIWLKVQLKNDLIALHKAEKVRKYDKYDYKIALDLM